jgi:hypothetical protein
VHVNLLFCAVLFYEYLIFTPKVLLSSIFGPYISTYYKRIPSFSNFHFEWKKPTIIVSFITHQLPILAPISLQPPFMQLNVKCLIIIIRLLCLKYYLLSCKVRRRRLTWKLFLRSLFGLVHSSIKSLVVILLYMYVIV